MNESGTYYERLMASYFSGESTPEEVKQLSAWLTDNPANLEAFEAYRKVWMLASKDALASGMDVDAEWRSFAGRMKASGAETPVSAKQPETGKVIRFPGFWKAAAIALLLIAAASVLFYLGSGPSMITLTADTGPLEKVLPDGTVITLNLGSEISYPEKFGNAMREVNLQGEAYFDVRRDAQRPFVVSGGKARIKVLGTSFNVNAAAGSKYISVVLTSGKVALYFEGDEANSRWLNPGEMAEMDPEKQSIRTGFNTNPNYMAWKSGVITFENTGLSEVAATLGNVYHTEVRLSGSHLSGCRLTATFENQPLNQVLRVIGETLGLTIRKENGTVIIEGEGCN